MLKSMTGYGTANYHTEAIEVTVEVKCLNSKFLDANIRMSRAFLSKEVVLKNLLTEHLSRGNVTLSVEVTRQQVGGNKAYDEQLFLYHYNELSRLAKNVNSPPDDVFRLAIQSPDVIKTEKDDADEDTWRSIIEPQILQAINHCDEFRISEGKVLMENLHNCITSIKEQLEKVNLLDRGRVTKIKNRIRGNLKSIIGEENIDKNRFEQELVYYVEKLDISEEKVRLDKHLDYFVENMESEKSQGKKLNFISQEIGREINTIGSKANDAQIQQHVVMMKEDLEKIKEQLLNVL